jgi:hypothetical protein
MKLVLALWIQVRQGLQESKLHPLLEFLLEQFKGWSKQFKKLELTSANLVVEALKSLVKEMFVLLSDFQKLTVACHFQKLPMSALFK